MSTVIRKRARATAAHHMSANIVNHNAKTGEVVDVIPVELPPQPLSAVKQLFMRVFTATTLRVECKEDWANGTGYFDGVVDDEQLQAQIPMGGRATFVDEHGRKALVLRTTLGMAVVFERYSKGAGPLVSNMESKMRDTLDLAHGALPLESLQCLLLAAELSTQA